MKGFQVKREIKLKELVFLATWGGVGRTGRMAVHASRWLVGRGKPTATSCGLEVDDFPTVDVYKAHNFMLMDTMLSYWCPACRATVDEIRQTDEACEALVNLNDLQPVNA